MPRAMAARCNAGAPGPGRHRADRGAFPVEIFADARQATDVVKMTATEWVGDRLVRTLPCWSNLLDEGLIEQQFRRPMGSTVP